MTAKPKVGRPRRAGKVADERITIRLTRAELVEWNRRAKAEEKALGEWIRDRCNK